MSKWEIYEPSSCHRQQLRAGNPHMYARLSSTEVTLAVIGNMCMFPINQSLTAVCCTLCNLAATDCRSSHFALPLHLQLLLLLVRHALLNLLQPLRKYRSPTSYEPHTAAHRSLPCCVPRSLDYSSIRPSASHQYGATRRRV